MPLYRRAVACLLSAALTALAPGLEPYRLLAQVKTGVEVPVTVGTPGLGQAGSGVAAVSNSLAAPASLASPAGLAATLPLPAASPKAAAAAPAAAAQAGLAPAQASPAGAAPNGSSEHVPPKVWSSPAPAARPSSRPAAPAPANREHQVPDAWKSPAAAPPAPSGLSRAAGAEKAMGDVAKGADASAALGAVFENGASRPGSPAAVPQGPGAGLSRPGLAPSNGVAEKGARRPAVSAYFSDGEFRRLHPKEGGVYHDSTHSRKVAEMAWDFAAARGLDDAQARFVHQVGLLHDVDPGRTPGSPARVPATLEALRADFRGERSLNGEAGRSVLRERFGWGERQLAMAEAMIQRTEFPFGDSHPSPAYKGSSPLARYEAMLRALPEADRAFVLREGALLSEYADKSSWYATEGFAGALKVVEGLANEINTATGGKAQMTAGKLDTAAFLSVIGEPGGFALDAALAAKLGLPAPSFPSRAEAFRLLGGTYGAVFAANVKGFEAYKASLAEGPSAAAARGAEAAGRARAEAEGPSVDFLKKAPAAPGQGFLARTKAKLAGAAASFSGFNRSEKAYILGQAVFLFAISIYLATLPLLVQALAGDAAMTGVARAVHYWTFAGASLVAGGIVKRSPMKRILVGGAVSRALIFGSIGFLGLVGGLPWAGFLGLVAVNAVVVSLNHLVDIDTDGARKVFSSDKKIEQGGYLYDLIYYGMMLVVPPLIGMPMDWLDHTYGPGIGAAVGFATFAGVMSVAALIYAKYVRVAGEATPLLDRLGFVGRAVKTLRSGWEILRETPRRNWETLKLIWGNKKILSRSLMATAENFVEDALFAVVLPSFAIDILKVGATGNGLLLSAVTLGGLLASTFLVKYAQKIQGRIGAYQFLTYLTIGASLAFIPSVALWSAPTLFLALPAVLVMKMLYQPLRSRMRALLQTEIRNDPLASKHGEDINGLMTVFEVLSAGAGGLAFAWLFGHAGPGTPLFDLFGENAPMKAVTLALVGISAVYIAGLRVMKSSLPHWSRLKSPSGAEAKELEKLDKNLAKLGLPPVKTVRVREAVSNDRPTVGILAPASVYKLSLAREGGRQAPGDVNLVLDASWLVRQKSPDGSAVYMMKKGLFFDADGQAWLAEYDTPRRIRYRANFFTLGSNDRDDGVPYEKDASSPMSSSVELEAVTNDKLFTRMLMAAKGVGVPATLAFLLPSHPLAARAGFESNGVTLAELPKWDDAAGRTRARVAEFLAANKERLGDEVVVKPSGPQWHSSRGVKFFKTTDADGIAAHVIALSKDGMMTPDGAVLIDERLAPPPLYFRVSDGPARAPPTPGYSGKGLRMGADVSLQFLSKAEAGAPEAAAAKRDWNMRLFAQRTPWGGTVNSAVFVRAGVWGKPTVADPGGADPTVKPDPEDAAVVMPFEDVIKALQEQHGLLKSPAEAAAFREDLERTAKGTLESLWENESKLRAEGKIPALARTDFVGLDVMLDFRDGKLTPKVIEINDHDSGGQMQLDHFYPERAGEHSRAWVATMLQEARRDALKGKHILMVGGGYYGKRFIFERAKELGVKITLVDRPGSLMADLVDRYVPVETLDKEKAADAAFSALEEAGLAHKFDGITSFWEDDLPLTSQLASKLGLPYLPLSGTEAARNKRKTREVMAKAGLPTPRFAPARNPEELEEAIKTVGFPAILKPVSGAEAKFVKEVRSAEEARAALRQLDEEVRREAASDGAFSNSLGLVMEQFLEGDEVDVDLVMQDGKAVFSSVTDNWPTKRPYFLATGSSLPSHLPSSGQEELRDLAVKSAQALGLDRGILHVEMKLTPEGPRVIEVNARMGGVYVRDWVLKVWGVDMVEEGFMAAVSIPGTPYKSPSPLTHLEGRFLIPEASGVLEALDTAPGFKDDPGLYELRRMIKPGTAVRVPPDGNDRVGMLTAQGRSAKEAEANLARLEGSVTMSVKR